MGRIAWVAVLFFAGCSEYQLSDKEDPTVPLTTDTGTPPPTTTDLTDPPTTPPDTGTPPDPTCDDSELPDVDWMGSPTFTDAVDPVDGLGTPFWDPTADTSDWEALILPDRAIPIGEDRAYVGRFELTEIPVNLSLNLQSDDGIVVWLNGEYLGQWGGDWQLEGCVNENAQCLVTIQVAPVDVTPLLQVGTNVLAARVSNPVENAYFEIIPECVD